MHATAEALSVIDEILAGDGLSLADAARHVPSFRPGRPTHAATIWRWATKGVRLHDGTVIKLETCRCGGRQMTSRAALGRFIRAQTPEADIVCTPTPAAATPARRKRSCEHAEKELDRIGI